MKLRESVVIAAAAEDVWPWVADPVLQAGWNPKIVEVNRDAKGLACLGEKFSVVYRMRGRETKSLVEVTRCQPPLSIAFQHSQDDRHVVEELYTIEPCAKGSRLLQTIDLSRAAVPWPFRVIMWLINRLGRPQGQPYLDRLRELVEQSAAGR